MFRFEGLDLRMSVSGSAQPPIERLGDEVMSHCKGLDRLVSLCWHHTF